MLSLVKQTTNQKGPETSKFTDFRINSPAVRTQPRRCSMLCSKYAVTLAFGFSFSAFGQLTGTPLSGGTSGNATTVNGAAVPASQSCLGSNASSQFIAGTCSGSGNTTSTSLTTNAIPKANGATSIVNSLLSDTGTLLSYTGTGGISSLGYATTGTVNGFSNFIHSGVAAAAPGVNAWQISPAVSITTPWSFSPAAAPATGVWYGTLTSGVVQQSFKTLQGTDSNILTAGTISGTLALLCTDANGGATTVSCPSGGSVANYYTSGLLTRIGPSNVTPTENLDVGAPTDTSISAFVFRGTAQSGNVFGVGTSTGSPDFSVSSSGAISMAGKLYAYFGTTTAGYGIPAIQADLNSLATARTTAISSSPGIALIASQTFQQSPQQMYRVNCYANVNTAAASTAVNVFITWVDNASATLKTSTENYSLNTASTANTLSFTKVIDAYASGGTSSNVSYYTTLTGTGQSYGIDCGLERLR
jgi:hypothetical protein